MKNILLLAGFLVVLVIVSGCGTRQPSDKENELVTYLEDQLEETQVLETAQQDDAIPKNFIDLFDIDLDAPTPTPITPQTVGEDAYRVRFVFEAIKINRQVFEETVIDDAILDYVMEGCDRTNALYSIYDLEDFNVLLTNKDFITMFEKQYDKRITSYYLPKAFELNQVAIYFGTVDEVYYYAVSASNALGGWFVVVETDHNVTSEEIISFYAQSDGIQVNTAQTYGNDVYYMTAKASDELTSEVFAPEDIASNYTIYMWEQDGVIGLIVFPGGHTKDNLALCELVKHEFLG